MANMSNSAGVKGPSPFGKGGSTRVNGLQRAGLTRGETTAPQGGTRGAGGNSAIRPNSTQRSGLGSEGEYQAYKKEKATNKQKIAPSKTGGVR